MSYEMSYPSVLQAVNLGQGVYRSQFAVPERTSVLPQPHPERPLIPAIIDWPTPEQIEGEQAEADERARTHQRRATAGFAAACVAAVAFAGGVLHQGVEVAAQRDAQKAAESQSDWPVPFGDWRAKSIIIENANLGDVHATATQNDLTRRTTTNAMNLLNGITKGDFPILPIQQGHDIQLDALPSDRPFCDPKTTAYVEDEIENAIRENKDNAPADATRVVVVRANGNTVCGEGSVMASHLHSGGKVVVYTTDWMTEANAPLVLAHEFNHGFYGHDSAIASCTANASGIVINRSCGIKEYGNTTTLPGGGYNESSNDPDKLTAYEMDLLGQISDAQIKTIDQDGSHDVVLQEVTNESPNAIRLIRVPIEGVVIESNATNGYNDIRPTAMYVELSHTTINAKTVDPRYYSLSVKAYLVDEKASITPGGEKPSTYLLPISKQKGDCGLATQSNNVSARLQIGTKNISLNLRNMVFGAAGKSRATVNVDVKTVA